VAGRAAVNHARFSALPGASVFQTQYGAEVEATDVNGRIALVWDTRSNEFNPRTGVLVEGGAQAGRAGGASYTRLYTVMRGYVPLRPATVLAARFGASNMTGTPSFNSRFEIPTWENPMQVYGGYTSNRGYPGGRFVGSGVLFGSVELRQDFLPIGELASGTVVLFMDAGRVFENEAFTLDGRKLHVAAGIGLGARLLRSTIFTANLAKGGEGWRVSAGASWAF
jgi:outer membrane protein assembly factor BamA